MSAKIILASVESVLTCLVWVLKNLLNRLTIKIHSTLYEIVPLPPVDNYLSYDDCLDDKRENYQNCSVLY